MRRQRKRTFIIAETKFGRLKVKLVVVVSSCLLGFMRDLHAETWKGFLFASLLFLLSCLQSLLHHHYMFHCFTVGMRMKTAVMGLVYRKVKSCSPSSVVSPGWPSSLGLSSRLTARRSWVPIPRFFLCGVDLFSLCFPRGSPTSVSNKLGQLGPERQGLPLTPNA